MDVKCVICGEPWDSWGISESLTPRSGDMKYWEAQLFKQGAGCPCCSGARPEGGGFEPTGIFDFENGDEDEMERIVAYEKSLEGRAPEWKRPEDPVLWKCDGCGVEVRHNVDWHIDSEFGLEWYAALSSQTRDIHSMYSREAPTKEPAHVFKEHGAKLCDACLHHCDECGAPISSYLELSDVYDEGYAVYHQNTDKSYCIGCEEEKLCPVCEEIECCCERCEHCEQLEDECECSICPICEEKEAECECDDSVYE